MPSTPCAATSTPSTPSTGLDAFQAKALEIVVSGKVRDAFDLSKEPDKLHEAYGKKPIMFDFVPGTLFLQARRLIEAGVSVVGINLPGWDTHIDNFKLMRQAIAARSTRRSAALLTDLQERGMDKDVTILMAGEMGRDPRISKDKAGREHWPQAGIAVMAGGGLKMGQVIGASDARGAEVKGRAITPQMMLATLYHTMGIDPATTHPRPQRPTDVSSRRTREDRRTGVTSRDTSRSRPVRRLLPVE